MLVGGFGSKRVGVSVFFCRRGRVPVARPSDASARAHSARRHLRAGNLSARPQREPRGRMTAEQAKSKRRDLLDELAIASSFGSGGPAAGTPG